MLLDLTTSNRSSSSSSSSSSSVGGPLLSMSLRGELLRSADQNAVQRFGMQRRAMSDAQDFFVTVNRRDTSRELPAWAVAAAAAAAISNANKSKSKSSKAEEASVSGANAKCSRVGSEYQAAVPTLSSARPSVTASSNAGIHWSHTHERTIIPSTTSSRSRKATSEEIDALIADWLARRSRRAPTVGSVLVVRIPGPDSGQGGGSWRLCCVLEVVPTASSKHGSRALGEEPAPLTVHVYDGQNQWTVPVTHCQSPGASNAEHIALRVIHANGYNLQKATAALAAVDQDDEDAAAMAAWTLAEVEQFVSGIQRFGDDMRRIWQLLASKAVAMPPRAAAAAAAAASSSSSSSGGGYIRKSLAQVLDFYHRVYPHAAIVPLAGADIALHGEGGTERLLRIYRRAERAAEGDDEEEDEEVDDEEEVEEEDDEDDDDEDDEDDDDDDDEEEDEEEEDEDEDEDEEEDVSMDTDDDLFDQSEIAEMERPSSSSSAAMAVAARHVSPMDVVDDGKAGHSGNSERDDDSVSIYSIASVDIAAATVRGSSSSTGRVEVAFGNGTGWAAEGQGLSFNPAAD